MSTFTGGLSLTGESSFPNTLNAIYSDLMHLVSLCFSGTVPLFGSMDMVQLMSETDLHNVETFISLPKT